MWHELASPPENYRFYKFTDHSHEKQHPTPTLDLSQQRKQLFTKDPLKSVPEQGQSNALIPTHSQQSQKPVSSLKSTSKVHSGIKGERSHYDLQLNLKNSSTNHHSRSALQHISKQKSSLVLSQKQKSSTIREQPNKTNSSASNPFGRESRHSDRDSFLQCIENVEEQDDFSRIFINQINKTEEQILKGNMFKDKQKGQIFLKTLLEIRDIQREQLNYQKKLLKMAQDKGQISFLYEREDRSQQRFFKPKKEVRKSFKRTQQKSTIKKLGKSIIFQQRLNKIEEKCKDLQKKLEAANSRKTPTLSRTKKKSMSTLR